MPVALCPEHPSVWYSQIRMSLASEPIVQAAAVIVVLLAAVAVLAILMYLRNRGASRRELTARVAELQALSDAVSAIAAATLDEEALCQLVYERAARLIDVSNFQLGLFQDTRYVIRLRYSRGERQPEAAFDLSETGGIVGWTRDTGRALLVRDFEQEMDKLPAKPRYISASPPRSAIFVPMVTGESVIGMLAIQSEQPNAYTESHLRLLGIIANQAAAAITNARALEQQRTRAQQMELVSEVARSTATLFSLQTLLPRLVESIQRAFGYYFAGIFLVDELSQIVCMAASHAQVVGKRRQLGVGLVGTCIAQAQAVIVDDTAQDKRFLFDALMPNTRSEAVLPLVIGERVIGALDLESDTLCAFSGDQAQFLNVLAQQVAIAIEDARLYQQSMERQQLEHELTVAREIQTSFLPKVVPVVSGWSVAGGWEAAHQVGGDFYDYIPLASGEWGVVIADVADKGVPAALFMVMSRTLMRATAFSGRTPADALARVNQLIQSDSASDLFVTMLYAVWNPMTGTLTLANAGHNPPILCRACGEVSVLRSKGIALGIVDKVVIEPLFLTLEPGDALLLYTDGLIDALNADGGEYGLTRLQDTFREASHLDAKGIVAALQQAIDGFTGDEPAFDDQTLVVIKRDAAQDAAQDAGHDARQLATGAEL